MLILILLGLALGAGAAAWYLTKSNSETVRKIGAWILRRLATLLVALAIIVVIVIVFMLIGLNDR